MNQRRILTVSKNRLGVLPHLHRLVGRPGNQLSADDRPCGGGDRTGGRGAYRVLVAVGVVLMLAVAGCGSTGTPAGTALQPGDIYTNGIAPMRPGDQLGLLDVFLVNRSHSPITITSVTVPGHGVGTVVRVTQVKIAPDLAPSKAVYGGSYVTDPPVDFIGWCRRQVLRPVHGYRLAPGAKARLWEVFQFIHPGRFNIRKHIIHYTQNGHQYQQVLPDGYTGSVVTHAKYLPPDPPQARCVKPMHARLLTNIK